MNDYQQESYRPFPDFHAWLRTHFLADAFDRYASDLEEIKNSADKDTLTAAVETATRWAAIDTGAIEGLY